MLMIARTLIAGAALLVLSTTAAKAAECATAGSNPLEIAAAATELGVTDNDYLAFQLIAAKQGIDPCTFIEGMHHIKRQIDEARAPQLARPQAVQEDKRKRAVRAAAGFKEHRGIDMCPPPHRVTERDGCR